MTFDSSTVETATADFKTTNKPNKYLLTTENYDLLRQAQDRIKADTGYAPTFRKLINEIVNRDSIEVLIHRIIDTLNN